MVQSRDPRRRHASEPGPLGSGMARESLAVAALTVHEVISALPLNMDGGEIPDGFHVRDYPT